MTTQNQPEKQCLADAAEIPRKNAASALDWAVFGLLAAGGVGIVKALDMTSPSGVLICLLGSVAAFSTVIYAHSRRAG